MANPLPPAWSVLLRLNNEKPGGGGGLPPAHGGSTANAGKSASPAALNSNHVKTLREHSIESKDFILVVPS
jgi:hypothetical protein